MRKAFVFVALITISVACKKNDDTPLRKVSYNITGVYGGKLNIVYTNANGQPDTAKSVSSPWSKELVVVDTVKKVSLMAATDTTKTGGTAGQKLVALVTTGGVQRATDTATTAANGRLQTRSLSHTF